MGGTKSIRGVKSNVGVLLVIFKERLSVLWPHNQK
jgi:hypothetical protein